MDTVTPTLTQKQTNKMSNNIIYFTRQCDGKRLPTHNYRHVIDVN